MSNEYDKEKAYLKDVAPTLFGKKVEIPTDAPDDYFEHLESKIRMRIHDTPAPLRLPLRRNRLLRYGVAAGVAIVLGLVTYFRYSSSESASNAIAENTPLEITLPTDDAAIESLELYYTDELADEDLVSAALLAELSLVDIPDNQLIDYLMEPTELDDELLYEQFY